MTFYGVFLRILLNFFGSFSGDFKDVDQLNFFDCVIGFLKDFFCKAMGLMHPQPSEQILSTYLPYIDYFPCFVRVINSRYIDTCKQEFDFDKL